MMWIPLLIVLAIFAMLFKRNFFGGPSPEDDPLRRETRDPLDILKERYARGEIGKDEYQEKKKDLDR